MKIEKLRIFNKGKGWYISASNYRDPSDKAYMNVHFTNGTEPHYEQTHSGYAFLDIDCEAKFTSYKEKMGVTVFDYQIIRNDEKLVETDPNEGFAESLTGTKYEQQFGSTSYTQIKEDDLPFY